MWVAEPHSSANDSTHVQMISPLGTQIQHKVGCSMVLTLWKLLEPMGTQYCTKWAPAGSHFVESCWTHGYTILHKVDSCSPHFVQVIGPHGISMQFTLRAQINNMKFIYFYYAHSGFPCELVHTLCMWFHPWNHNISQNGFKISNSCL
jgi:hypothetical protein